MASFYRLSGGGNDFLAFVEPEEPPDREEIRALCRRGLSLGADGLFILRRTAAGAQMDYANADGRPAALCLNGTRCAARLAFELGWAENETEILTGAGAVRARRVGPEAVSLEVHVPGGRPAPTEVRVEGTELRGWRVLIGVPHFVVRWAESLARAPVATLGPPLRRSPAMGSDGANVNFVRFPSPQLIEIRTFERGVEAETLACGTGALAATAVGLMLGESSLPLQVQTLGGFRLSVEGEVKDGEPLSWSLTGDARVLARGELTPAARQLPPPPDWSA